MNILSRGEKSTAICRSSSSFYNQWLWAMHHAAEFLIGSKIGRRRLRIAIIFWRSVLGTSLIGKCTRSRTTLLTAFEREYGVPREGHIYNSKVNTKSRICCWHSSSTWLLSRASYRRLARRGNHLSSGFNSFHWYVQNNVHLRTNAQIPHRRPL